MLLFSSEQTEILTLTHFSLEHSQPSNSFYDAIPAQTLIKCEVYAKLSSMVTV